MFADCNFIAKFLKLVFINGLYCGWWVGSMVQGTDWSFRGISIPSIHMVVVHKPLTPVPGIWYLTPSSSDWAYFHVKQTNRQTKSFIGFVKISQL